jgi:hypothetical protein
MVVKPWEEGFPKKIATKLYALCYIKIVNIKNLGKGMFMM